MNVEDVDDLLGVGILTRWYLSELSSCSFDESYFLCRRVLTAHLHAQCNKKEMSVHVQQERKSVSC